MSIKTATKFLEDANTTPTLQKSVLAAVSSASACVAAAAAAGYEITVDELRSAVEVVVGKPVSADELGSTLRGLFAGELQDESLEAVTGGAGPAAQKLAPAKLNVATAQGQLNRGAGVSSSEFVGEREPIRGGSNIPTGGQRSGGG